MASTTTKCAASEATALFRDLDKPSLHALSYALRHPDAWPEDFFWNYKKCTQCAMGLAHRLWKEIPCHRDGSDVGGAVSKMAKSFGMPFEHAKGIFMGLGPRANWVPRHVVVSGHLWWRKTSNFRDDDAITPEMVADQIDAYLERAE